MSLNVPFQEIRRTEPSFRATPLVTITWTDTRTHTARAPQQPDPTEHWRTRGACRLEEDPDLFFPVGNSPQAQAQTANAKAVCMACPVRRECLNWALETHQDDGVLGGLSEDERRELHRRHSRKYKAGAMSAAALIVQYRRAEYEELDRQGLSVSEMARKLRTNTETVYRVAAILAGEVKVAPARPRPAVDKVLVRWPEVEQLRCEGVSPRDIAEHLGVGKNALYDAQKLKQAQAGAEQEEVAV
jgi:WhiB family redox-sensing transcriptional regulator